MSETIVVKLGGNVASDPAQIAAIGADLAALAAEGAQIAIVHGGGPQVTALSEKLGIEPRIIGGRRVTDDAALDVVKYVLAGQMSVDFTCALGATGLQTVGLSGVSAGLIEAVKRPPRVVTGGGPDPVDFGHVGDIVGVNVELLRLLMAGGYVPVVNSVAADAAHRPYNINADVAGTRIASALQADHLLLLTGGVAGVLRDKDDPTTRIPRLTAGEARDAIASGIIQGGMIPKIEEALEVLESGVGAIHILGDVGPSQVLAALRSPGEFGTAVVR